MVVVRPTSEGKLRDRAVPYRPKTDSTTALIVDPLPDPDHSSFGKPSPEVEAIDLVRVYRSLNKQSENLSVMVPGPLPSAQEAFDGIDQMVIASSRLTTDVQGRAAVRKWVEQGGQLWIMLDQVDEEILGSLLGEETAPRVVQRTSLTRVLIERPTNAEKDVRLADRLGVRMFEDPVAFVRVALTGRESVHHYVDYWPASFSIPVGRGTILVTTLGPRGWTRPRGFAPATVNAGRGRPAAPVKDPPSPYRMHPHLPVALDSLIELTIDLKKSEHSFTIDDFQPILREEIGYSVPNRSLVGGILAVFVLALLAAGLLVRRSRQIEYMGWLIPATAVVAGLVFYVLGSSSRHTIPPTAAIAELAEAVPGSGEISRTGLFASYQPAAGELNLSAPDGGVLNFDFEGLEGQNRTHVQTDRESWHYENLYTPAGVRLGRFSSTISGDSSAVASFGPDGVSGVLNIQKYTNPADAILVARDREPVAAQIRSDGSFTIGQGETLAANQYLTDTLLSDRQQRRQEVFQKLVGSGLPPSFDTRDYLLTWMDPEQIPFQTGEGSRAIGSSLVVVPVTYERPAPGTKVFVPQSYLPYRRWLEGRPRMPTLESTRPIEMELRFQLPETLIPMVVDEAEMTVRLRAPSRTVKILGYYEGKPSTIREQTSPAEPIRVKVTDPRYLKLDAKGGLHLGLAIVGDDAIGNNLESFWTIESIHLTLSGNIPDAR